MGPSKETWCDSRLTVGRVVALGIMAGEANTLLVCLGISDTKSIVERLCCLRKFRATLDNSTRVATGGMAPYWVLKIMIRRLLMEKEKLPASV